MTAEFFAFARWVGFFWIVAMLIISFLAIRGHRLVFFTMIAWIGSLFVVGGLRQANNVEMSEFVRDWVSTPIEYSVPIVMVLHLLQYLRKQQKETPKK